MSFNDLQIKRYYSSKNENLIDEFYDPVLREARCYDRITGYFSPSILSAAAKGFSSFIINGAKLRLLTGVELDEDTIATLKAYPDTEIVDKLILKSFDEMVDEMQSSYLSYFSYMLSMGILEMRILCMSEKNSGILHQKIGIVEDNNGNCLVFSGSNNETTNGWKKNLEEFAVFKSWNSDDIEAIEHLKDDFEELWYGDVEGTLVLPASEAVKEKIISSFPPSIKRRFNPTPQEQPRTPRDYQQEAINAWRKNNYSGIFEMATGTGKTLTSLFAAKELLSESDANFIVISVPLKHLITQWEKDVVKLFPQAQIIKVSSDFTDWRTKLSLAANTYSNNQEDRTVIVITTYASMTSGDFQDILQKYSNRSYCLIADEVHNIRNQKTIDLLDSFKYKLGLSATPKNQYAENEADGKIDEMINRFGGIIYEYPLSLAIKKGVLVKYNYHPIIVGLNENEAEEYERLSRIISAHYDNQDDDFDITGILNKRAMVIKNAEEKTNTLSQLIDKLKQNHECTHMLVYCDNSEQISTVQDILNEKNISSSKITYLETMSERQSRLEFFQEGKIDCLVARKCLDEGVDIPATKTAIILASNTDQREYIQRLGRILRNYTNEDLGIVKEKSDIYDYVVMPPEDKSERYRYLLKGEFRRMAFFINNSNNKEENIGPFNLLIQKYNYKEENER